MARKRVPTIKPGRFPGGPRSPQKRVKVPRTAAKRTARKPRSSGRARTSGRVSRTRRK